MLKFLKRGKKQAKKKVRIEIKNATEKLRGRYYFRDKGTIEGNAQLIIRGRKRHVDKYVELRMFGECVVEKKKITFITIRKEFSVAELKRYKNRSSTYQIPFTFKIDPTSHNSFNGRKCATNYWIELSFLKLYRRKDIFIENNQLLPKGKELFPQRIAKRKISVRNLFDFEIRYTQKAYNIKKGVINGSLKLLRSDKPMVSVEVNIIRKEIVTYDHKDRFYKRKMIRNEVVDGDLGLNETVRFRIFLRGIKRLSTNVLNVENQFKVKYYIQVFVVCEDGKKYYKNIPIELFLDHKINRSKEEQSSSSSSSSSSSEEESEGESSDESEEEGEEKEEKKAVVVAVVVEEEEKKSPPLDLKKGEEKKKKEPKPLPKMKKKKKKKKEKEEKDEEEDEKSTSIPPKKKLPQLPQQKKQKASKKTVPTDPKVVDSILDFDGGGLFGGGEDGDGVGDEDDSSSTTTTTEKKKGLFGDEEVTSSFSTKTTTEKKKGLFEGLIGEEESKEEDLFGDDDDDDDDDIDPLAAIEEEPKLSEEEEKEEKKKKFLFSQYNEEEERRKNEEDLNKNRSSVLFSGFGFEEETTTTTTKDKEEEEEEELEEEDLSDGEDNDEDEDNEDGEPKKIEFFSVDNPDPAVPAYVYSKGVSYQPKGSINAGDE